MTRKAAFHNLGCKVNAYEVEAMQQALEEAGYEIVPFSSDADVYIINTCTVTNIADRKSRQMLHRAKKQNPDALVVAVGCYAQLHGEELQKDPAIDLVIGSNRKTDLAEEIARLRSEVVVSDLHTDRRYEPLQLSRSEEHTRAIVKIQDGCDNYCTYCIIPYARGHVRSRDPENVREEVARLVQNGAREVVLTGIHLCSYGKDLAGDTDLLSLLQELQEGPGEYRIRLGSLEPSFLTKETVSALAAMPRLCPHFHLSLQSGCDATLQRMGRRYTTEEYAEKVRMLREAFEDPALTTDLIAGFPGETEEEFAATCAFVERMAFFETHVFPYSRRAGTRAAEMEGQWPEACKKERTRTLLALHRMQQQRYLETFLQRPVEVLFEEEITRDGKRWISGHGRRYQQVLCAPDVARPGDLLQIVPHAVCDGVLLA